MNVNNKSVLFFGTDDVSLAALEALLASNVDIIGVVTKPDQPSGRKKEIIYSPIKTIAIEKHLKLFQPEKLKDNIDQILSTKPDMILVCSYGKIMSSQLDAGNIIDQIKIKIDDHETGVSLKEKVKKSIYDYLTNNLDKFFDKHIKTTIQDETKATFVKPITREDEKIDWTISAKLIDAKIRALYDKRIAYTIINGLNIKVYAATIVNGLNTKNYSCGEIIDINNQGIFISCKDESIKQIINGRLPFKKGDKFN